MIALKRLIGGSMLAMAVGALPMMAYAGDRGDDYHHGDGMESYHYDHRDMDEHHGHGMARYHHGHGDMDEHHGRGDMGDHHGRGDMGEHHGRGDMGEHMHGGNGHIMRGHLRVDVYIHKAGEEKHKKHDGEHLKSHWEHAHHGGWAPEKSSKIHGHHGDWDHRGYGYEGHRDRGDDHYDRASERHGHWDAEQYGDASGGGRGDYPDDGGGD